MKMINLSAIKTASFVLVMAASTLHAEITLPKAIGSGMVLQRDSEVAIWGTADPGDPVTITCSWNNTPVNVKTDSCALRLLQ